jgi:RHS repeat-associated protein
MAASYAAYESESLVESLDYYPFGGQRIDTKTSYGGVRNKYAGTVYDTLSALNYMQARYQNPTRGQFISEDPVFLGDPSQQNLKDPQSLNSYSYANDNPIAKSDPTGLYSVFDNPTPQAVQYWNNLNVSAAVMGQDPAWNFAFNHPITTGAMVAVGSYPALASGGAAAAAFNMALWPGVSATFAAQQATAGLFYSALTVGNTLSAADLASSFSQADPKDRSSFYPFAWSLTKTLGPSFLGGRTGSIADVAQFAGMVNKASGNFGGYNFANTYQARVGAVSTFNSVAGGSSNQSKLWVTPNGAVVTWTGGVVSEGIKK